MVNPRYRTESGRPLRVPLCDRAVQIVRSALPNAKCGYLFSGYKEGRPLSNMAMLALLKRMYRGLGSPCTASDRRFVTGSPNAPTIRILWLRKSWRISLHPRR
ncbi:hypothetical protein BDI4_210059 [Burkholderia diffusa]|nr:hypothetical protein BDI4_210059 [Burkholderia diffusa]